MASSASRLQSIGELTRTTTATRREDDVRRACLARSHAALDVVGEQDGETVAAQRSRELAERIEIGVDEENPARQVAPSVQEPNAGGLPRPR